MKTSLKIIKQQLQTILTKLDWTYEPNNTTGTTKISGLKNIRSVVISIESLSLFDDITDFIKNSIIFTSSNDMMVIQITEGKEIDNKLRLLSILIQNFLSVLLNTVPEE